MREEAKVTNSFQGTLSPMREERKLQIHFKAHSPMRECNVM